MYYPIQLPYILNQEFSDKMRYTETSAADCGGFVVCFWEMQPLTQSRLSVTNIIAADGCIDLVAAYDDRQIGFSGMSETDFNFEVELPKRYMGARLMPGAFHQLTGLPASAAMDTFLPVNSVFDDFDQELFFSLPLEKAARYFRSFFARITTGKTPDAFTLLFNVLSEETPDTASELYSTLHFSPRQCQRIFAKHYGVSPKMVLSIIRFQKCLEILTSTKASPADILNATRYYDQSHFINDFKQNIGLTPLEFIGICRT